MSDELREHLEAWLSMNRDFLWKVMSQKEKVDGIFRNTSVSLDELTRACDEVEAHLDDLKDMLKKLYLLLFEAQDIIKKERGAKGLGRGVKEKMSPGKEARPKPRKEVKRKEAAPRKAATTSPERRFATLEVPTDNRASTLADAADEIEAVEVPRLEFEVPDKIGGLINFLGLADWFKSLGHEDQVNVVSIMASDGKIMPHDVLERDIQTLRPQFAPYCWKTANKLMGKGYDELATGLLIKGLTVVTEKRDKEMLHIMYAKHFYRQRKMLKNAYDACINHCLKAIKSYLQDKSDRPKPVAPFKLLTMIYEEKGGFEKIIEVCDQAIKLYQGGADEPKVLGFVRIRDILKKKVKQAKG